MTIERTFGAGGDYARFKDILNFLNGIVVANDYTFVQVGDCNETINDYALEFDPNGYTIKFTNDSYHYGELSRGNKIYLPNDSGVYIRLGNTGRIIVEKLNIEKTAWDTGLSSGVSVLNVHRGGAFADNSNILIDKCLTKSSHGLPVGGFGSSAIYVAGFRNNSTCIIKASKAWNASGTGYCFRIGVDANSLGTIENCSAYFDTGSSPGNYCFFLVAENGSQGYIRNCVGSGAGVGDFANLVGSNMQAINCADADGSLVGFPGSRNISNITPADEFISLDDSTPYFLKLKNGSLVAGASALPVKGRAPLKVQFTNSSDYVFQSRNLGDGGTVPLYTTEDIGLNPIPTDEQFYSIGCHQVEVV